jgi:hypothetical protein
MTTPKEKISNDLKDIHSQKSRAKSKEDLIALEELQLETEQLLVDAKKQVTTPMSNSALSSPFVVKAVPAIAFADED